MSEGKERQNSVAWSKGIHFKMASFVILTVLIIFGSYATYQFYQHQQKLDELRLESSELLARALTGSLEIAMLNSDIEGIQHSFEQVAGNSQILRVFLMNTEGEVRASSDSLLLGSVLKKSDEGCAVCHSKAESESLHASIRLKSQDALRIIAPIMNKPECHSCHDPSQRLNGLIALDRSLRPAKAAFQSSIIRAAAIVSITILVMMFLFRWYFRRQVINRVTYLESLARRIINNELDLDISLSGRDELASLAHSFDNMKRELKSSIDKIRQHHNYLHNLLNDLTDGILIVNDNDKVVFVNDSFTAVLNLENRERHRDDSIATLLRESSCFAQIINQIEITRKYKSATNELIHIGVSEGKEKHLQIHTGPLIIPPDNRPEVIIVARDVTELINLEKQMAHSEKLATVGRLAAGVAHEINNPMASILACAEGLLKRQDKSENGVREYLEIITSSAQRCKMATQKLLDYSATSNLRKETVSLEAIVREAVDMLQFEASKKKVKLNVSSKKTLPQISGSRDSLMQVFVNLVVNSIQAVDGDGRVDIVLDATETDIEVSVVDNGSGMNEETKGLIFEPFFTTKPVGMGTGLGLSVSEGIVKQHNGRIEIVESRPGRTCIRVLLPIDIIQSGNNYEQ